MGNICMSCCKESTSCEDLTPDVQLRAAGHWLEGQMHLQETMRRKQMEAAERRIAEQQGRGIKDIESVKRQQRLDELREKRMEEAGNVNPQNALKWQVGH